MNIPAFRRGFSLVEILVVVAVIATLVLLIIPGVALVRQQALRVVCASNQHQLYLGVSAYTTDNAGMLPTSNAWNAYRGVCFAGLGYSRTDELAGTASTRQDWWGLGRLLGGDYLEPSKVFNCPGYTPTRLPYHDPYRGGSWRLPAMVLQIEMGAAVDIYGAYSLNSAMYESGTGRGRIGVPVRVGGSTAPDRATDPGGYGPISQITSLILCRGYGSNWDSSVFEIGQNKGTHMLRGVNCAFLDGQVKWLAFDPGCPTRWGTSGPGQDIYNSGSGFLSSSYGYWSWAEYMRRR